MDPASSSLRETLQNLLQAPRAKLCAQMLPAMSLSEIMLRWLHKQIRSEMTLRLKEIEQYSHAHQKNNIIQ